MNLLEKMLFVFALALCEISFGVMADVGTLPARRLPVRRPISHIQQGDEVLHQPTTSRDLSEKAIVENRTSDAMDDKKDQNTVKSEKDLAVESTQTNEE